MMTGIIPFDFATNAVRVVLRAGAPWCVAADMAKRFKIEPFGHKGTGAVTDLLRDRAFTSAGLDCTSGANAGPHAEVLGHDVTDGGAILTPLEAPVRAIAPGDRFVVRAGCDKRLETCSATFANTASFQGFPHIPGQDAVLRYAAGGRA